MKISELLTEKEIQEIQKNSIYGILINTDQVEMKIEHHILELEPKDYFLYKIYKQLEEIKYTLERAYE